MSAATELESSGKVAEHITETIFGEKKIGSEIRSCSGGLFSLLGGWGWRLGIRAFVIGRVLVLKFRARVRLRVWVGISRRAVTGPVTRAAALVASGGRRF